MEKPSICTPDYANVLFREALGMTLMDYLLAHRIAHAQRMLATTSEKIAGIAFALGFGSISRFDAALNSVSNWTPTECRQQRHFNDNEDG